MAEEAEADLEIHSLLGFERAMLTVGPMAASGAGERVVVPLRHEHRYKAPRVIGFDREGGNRKSWGVGGPTTTLLFVGARFIAQACVDIRSFSCEANHAQQHFGWGACAPDGASGVRCGEGTSLRYVAGDLCCACAERRAPRGS